MRPVDKGEEPKEKYSKYQEAEKILEERIGAYCSFCEFPIMHVPEVEHREENFLHGRIYCYHANIAIPEKEKKLQQERRAYIYGLTRMIHFMRIHMRKGYQG